jgi:hypothetical protein
MCLSINGGVDASLSVALSLSVLIDSTIKKVRVTLTLNPPKGGKS